MTPAPPTLSGLREVWLKRATDALNMVVSSREAQVAHTAAIAECADELAAALKTQEEVLNALMQEAYARHGAGSVTDYLARALEIVLRGAR